VTSPSYIDYFDGALEPDYCAGLIARFEADEHTHPGMVTGANGQSIINPEFKKVTELSVSLLPMWADVESYLVENVGKYLGVLKNIHPGLRYLGSEGGTIVKGNFSNFRMKRYDSDGHFDWHADNVYFAQSCRVLTVQWYLNTVEEGGETEFAEHGLKVKPVVGRLITFPPVWTHFHRAMPPVSEPKYIMNTWLQFDGTDRIP